MEKIKQRCTIIDNVAVIFLYKINRLVLLKKSIVIGLAVYVVKLQPI